eukprot:PhF_6_TR33502/c0_g1_i1/m.48838
MTCICVCAVSPLLIHFYHDPPRNPLYMGALITVVILIRQLGIFCMMCMYSTFALYCRFELASTSSTGTQMTVMTSFMNVGKLLASTSASYIAHVITTHASPSVVPYYVLSGITIPLGLCTALFVVRPR